jgi:putative polyhydroxyalkanoate system protein
MREIARSRSHRGAGVGRRLRNSDAGPHGRAYTRERARWGPAAGVRRDEHVLRDMNGDNPQRNDDDPRPPSNREGRPADVDSGEDGGDGRVCRSRRAPAPSRCAVEQPTDDTGGGSVRSSHGQSWPDHGVVTGGSQAMASIEIRRQFKVEKSEAKRKTESFARKLEDSLEFDWEWQGDMLLFESPRGAARGTSGAVSVGECGIAVMVELPDGLCGRTGEVVAGIDHALDRLFV